jgi:geranylgeranyl diphosphate synthase type II
MGTAARIEHTLRQALDLARAEHCPPLLGDAVRYAVVPGGARIRPKLCLAVARACGDDRPALANGAAAAIELLHCASLVHDDLPCFDNAPLRRGKSSVHRAYGERIAVLVGDALIALAFEAIARASATAPRRLPPLTIIVAQAIGAARGIIGGQAWECEPEVPLQQYQRAKTGALFAAATAAGACAAGHDWTGWYALGERLGEAYQIADDIKDVYGNEHALGKPVGRDQALGRPNAVHKLGISGSVSRVEQLVRSARIPDCPGAAELSAYLQGQVDLLLPRELVKPAA